jgi:RHS repeat-associated protein
MTYPNNFGVNYIYDNNGYITGMTRTDNGEQIWSFGEENRFGQLTDYTLGNDIQMALEYDAISGLPTSIDNGQNWGMSYDFDVHTGNLNSRGHLYNGLTEDFQYDNLDRLISYNTATNPLSVTYANTGSITFKGDAGRYTNHQPTGRTTSVDHESSASGFEISDVSQNITYTAFNSVETIVEGAYEAFFTYGPDQQRSKMLINHHGSTYIERMYMAGGQYERDHLPDGSWRNLTYISTPAGLSAVFIQNEGSQEEEFYFIHTDYQGSIMALTDYNGQLVEEYSYDPWGNRRDPNTWQTIYTNTTNPTAGQSGSQSLLWGVGGALFRGYTFHEHLDCFALINMNGRMYDPVLGRMLSADNYMHSGTQGLNRYAYVYNNPLKYTDPSGEIIHLAVGAMIGGIANTLSNAKNINSFGDGLMYFGIGAVGGAIGAGIGAGIVSTVAGGKFMAGFIGASQSISATAASYSSFANGFLSGFSGGFSGGFVSGLGNSLYSGDNFGQAIKSGLRAGFVAGVSSGFIGGLIGGFHAVNDGRRFSDGATVYKLKSEVSGITNVTQSNPNNCLPANGELASNSLGDNVSQHDGRNWFGGSGPINDEEFWLEYANQTGRSIERLSSSQDPVYELMRLIDDGYRVSISVPGENGIGHAVFLKSYSRKIVLKLNYDVIVSDKIVVWNPGISNINNQITSGFQNFSTTDIRTAWNIWLIK